MQIKIITEADISLWQALSFEYDGYVSELVGDLTEWYEGNDDSLAFTTYMRSKIAKQEAFMAIDYRERCLGVVALSKKNNCITFFAISKLADFFHVGEALIWHAFKCLNTSRPITINEIASHSDWIAQHQKLYTKLGFIPIADDFENGVPVIVFQKCPSVSQFLP